MRDKKFKASSGDGITKEKKIFFTIFTLIYIATAAVFAGMVIWLDLLPGKYLYMILGAVLTASILTTLLLNIRKRKTLLRIIGVLLALILMVVYAVGIYYIYSTQDMFSKIGNIGKSTEEYYVVARASDDKRNSIEDIKGEKVVIFDFGENSYDEAQNRLIDAAGVEMEVGKDYLDVSKRLMNKDSCNLLLLSASYYNLVCEEVKNFEEKTKIIYTLSIESELKSIVKSVESISTEPFSIFISGIDVFGTIDVVSRSDVNIVVTVNPKTKDIYMTSIPRDSYVLLHSKQAMDKLTHSGIYGISETVSTVEDLIGTDINYYVRVNFSSVINIVDAIGGIDVYSSKSFTTSGRQNTGYKFKKGMNHLSGEEALAFSRERHAFKDGDFQRNRNQQKVLKALLKKMLSSKTILTKYTQLLSATKNELQTNMSKDEIRELVKMQLADMPEWNIRMKSLTGTTGTAPCYSLGNMNASVVYLDSEEVKKIGSRVDSIEEGEPQPDDVWTWELD